MVRNNQVGFEHYFTAKPQSPLKLRKISAVMRGIGLEFFTGSGIFSPDKIDFGTALLANNCIIKEEWKVLDLGCGYGAVGIAIAKAHPSCKLTLIDINERAVMLAKKNAKTNYAEVEVIQGNMYEPVAGRKFDAILLNPPQTAGKKICEQMILEGKNHLVGDGLFQLVARHNKGGSRFEKYMKEVYGNAETIAKKGGYRVYVSKMVG